MTTLGKTSALNARLFELIDKMNTAHSASIVERQFIDFMQDEGFKTIGGRTIGNPFEENYLDLPEIYNGPEEFRRLWHERRYIRNDPTVLRALTTQIPFIWGQEDATTPIGKRILADASDFGLTEGVALPVHSLNQKPACVSLAGDRANIMSRSDLLTLGLTATHFFIVWSGFVEDSDEITTPLTPRERDVLYCAAAGLSGERISERLGIKISSVKSHMKSIRTKLNASSMAHAVAKGIYTGSICP